MFFLSIAIVCPSTGVVVKRDIALAYLQDGSTGVTGIMWQMCSIDVSMYECINVIAYQCFSVWNVRKYHV